MMKYILLPLVLLLTGFSQAALLAQENQIINIYKDTVPSVVNITSIQKVGGGFFGMPHEVPAGMGTGFIWDREGHIVTNFHVVQGSQNLVVTFQGDKKEYKAKVVGTSPLKDIAVIKLVTKPRVIKPISVGRSNNLQVGQFAIALGNPFGLDHSMSMGIISALGRKIEGVGGVSITDMIQTDAAINQGNSGGPLLNSSGEVIGMNTMIFSKSGSNAGLGFAVPVDTISRAVPGLIQYGKEVRPVIGISMLSEQIVKRYYETEGVAIESVVEDGPADRAGLQGARRDGDGRIYLGDLITQVDGKKVKNNDDIFHALDKYQVGDSIHIDYLRNGNKKRTKLKLESFHKMNYGGASP